MPIIVTIMDAQYSFPIKTESFVQGFRRHKVFLVKLNSCPPIAGLWPESDVVSNSQVVAMISAQDGKLHEFHCHRPTLGWHCRLDVVKHGFG